MILPTKIDVNKAQANQRKIEIDNGVALARQIDSLRSTFAQERVAHEMWKKSSIDELNRQMEGLQDGIDAKKREIIELDEQRRKLLEPLDKEWENVNVEKESIKEAKQELFLDQERHKEYAKVWSAKRNEIIEVIKDVKRYEEKTKTILISAKELEEVKRKDSEEIARERQQQEAYYQARRQSLDAEHREYEVALKTIELREKQVEEKESELLEREILLKDRIAMHERNLTRN